MHLKHHAAVRTCTTPELRCIAGKEWSPRNRDENLELAHSLVMGSCSNPEPNPFGLNIITSGRATNPPFPYISQGPLNLNPSYLFGFPMWRAEAQCSSQRSNAALRKRCSHPMSQFPFAFSFICTLTHQLYYFSLPAWKCSDPPKSWPHFICQPIVYEAHVN